VELAAWAYCDFRALEKGYPTEAEAEAKAKAKAKAGTSLGPQWKLWDIKGLEGLNSVVIQTT